MKVYGFSKPNKNSNSLAIAFVFFQNVQQIYESAGLDLKIICRIGVWKEQIIMMGRKTYGVDFGTNMIKIYKKGNGVVLAEKNVIAIEKKKRILATGDDAYEMLGKAPLDIEVSTPIQNGVIADISNMQVLLNHFLEKIAGKGKVKGSDFLVAVPTDITQVEKRAFYDLVVQSIGKARTVRVVEKPIATALGMDVDVTSSRGVMTVDIGGDTTEIAIMSLGGIVISMIIPVGGNKIDTSIQSAVKRKFNLFIGEKTAETIKMALASSVAPKEEEHIRVLGRDVVNGLPREAHVDSQTVYLCIKEHINGIINAVKMILERTPPEISSDIIETGIYVTGGSARIRKLAEVISIETGLQVNIAEEPEDTVVLGLGKIIENRKLISLGTIVK